MTDEGPPETEEVAFRVQPVESAERAHFGNFALISHTRFAGSARQVAHYRASANSPRFGYLSRALNQFQKYRGAAISRSGEKQTSRRVATSGIRTHTHTRACVHLECSRKRARLCVAATEILRLLFPPFSRDLALAFPFRFHSLTHYPVSLSGQAVDYPDLHAGYPHCKCI